MTIGTISKMKEGMRIEKTEKQIIGYGAEHNDIQGNVRRADAGFRSRLSGY